MRRSTFATIAVVAVLEFYMVATDGGTAVLAQEVSPLSTQPVRLSNQQLDFKVANSTTGETRVPHVVGQGGFPLRLAISGHNSRPQACRLQVMVALYVSESGRLKPGPMFQALTDPRILTANPEEDFKEEFTLDIPVLPGDYKAFVFLCDPDLPYMTSGSPHEEPYPDAEHFPGRIRRAKLVTFHVDPQVTVPAGE